MVAIVLDMLPRCAIVIPANNIVMRVRKRCLESVARAASRIRPPGHRGLAVARRRQQHRGASTRTGREETVRAFFPADSGATRAAQRMGTMFGDSDSNNIAYVVLDADRPLGEPDPRATPSPGRPAADGHPRRRIGTMDLWDDPTAAAVFERPGPPGGLSGGKGCPDNSGAAQPPRRWPPCARRSPPADPPEGCARTSPGPEPAWSTNSRRWTDGGEDHGADGRHDRGPALVRVPLAHNRRGPAGIGRAVAGARPSGRRASASMASSEVSVFSVALMSAAWCWAPGPIAASFLLGRYHENRRAGLAPPDALADALSPGGAR